MNARSGFALLSLAFGLLTACSSPSESDAQNALDAHPKKACVFKTKETNVCPGLDLPAEPWKSGCLDIGDCSELVDSSSAIAGCIASTRYEDVALVQMSCNDWFASQRDGGT